MLVFHKKRNTFVERKFKVFGPFFIGELLCDMSFAIGFAIPYVVFLYNKEILGPFCGGSLLDFSYWNAVVNVASGVYSLSALIILSVLYACLHIKSWLRVLEILFWMRYLIHMPALLIYIGLFYSIIYGAVCNVLNILNIVYVTLYSFMLFFSLLLSFREPDKRFVDSFDEEDDEKLIIRRRK